MGIYIGTSTNNQSNIYLGNTEYSKVFVGDKLVWQKDSIQISEWYLPSNDEFDRAFFNLFFTQNIPQMDSEVYYWTSSQSNISTNAVRVRKSNQSSHLMKNTLHMVRPVYDMIIPNYFEIGDYVGNGWVYFIDYSYVPLYKYYIIGEQDSPSTFEWGTYGESVATSVLTGTGRNNTQLILQKLNELGETDKAVQYCAQLPHPEPNI